MFVEIENTIKKDFTFKEEFDLKNKELSEEIKSQNAVCLNVRRGDFVTNPATNKFHGVLTMEYFDKALEIIASKIRHFSIFIFSDDIEWCKENIKPQYPSRIVEHEYAGKQMFFDFRHMILCKHFIIPNGTFGWWAAWLSQNSQKIVIAPKKWFRDPNINTCDLIPKTWIRI